MSRYIDADDVANAIYHHFPSIRTMADARGIIEEAPSIDIVFCKECKHWYRALDESGAIERFNFSRCTKGHSGNGLEFYCADGEREGE